MEFVEKIEVAPLMTIPTLARLLVQPGEQLDAKERSLRRMCEDGILPSSRIGWKWYVPRDVVLAGVIGREHGDDE